jgi:peptide/nickel transport system permease protein
VPAGLSEAVRNYTVPGLGEVVAGSFTDRIMHLILPVAVLTIVNVAGWSRFIRASMLEVMRQDYIRTARAKGLSSKVVILKHALRNALIPFVTIVVFTLPGLFSGAIITESIFAWPGMGRLYLLALGDYDYPVAMAIFFIIAVLTVIATLMRDILYTVVDPRIRLS